MKLTLSRTDWYSYTVPEGGTTELISNLYFFLVDDVGCDDMRRIEPFKKWVLDDSAPAYAINATFLCKDNNVISIGLLWRMDDTVLFTLSKKQFVEVLESWDELLKTYPKKIDIIIAKGDTIIMSGYENR